MIIEKNWQSRLFDVVNHVLLFLLAFLCLAPMFHLLAVSLSGRAPSLAGFVTFWPIQFTTKNYEKILESSTFRGSLLVSIERVVLGTTLNMLLTVLTAYPLSKTAHEFKGRNLFMWSIVFAMLFSGGLIPLFLTIRALGLLNNIGALILPGAVQTWHVILMMNFFRETPKELEDAALIDGASHWELLYHIYLPLSVPALATLTLFSAVQHWNSWFDGMVYMMDSRKYPMQTYLRTVVIDLNIQELHLSPAERDLLAPRSARAATIFAATVPILVVYPFLQRYFISGIRLGAVKG